MFSPALRHRQRRLAAQAAPQRQVQPGRKPPPPEKDDPAGQEYAALRVVLHDNLRSLKDIASHEARKPKKAEFAKTFTAWIEGVLAADKPVQDEILLTVMIWAIDTRDFDYALRLASFALRHGLAMPEGYSRTVACFVTEQIAEVALQQPDAVPHEVLLALPPMIEGHDMPDPVTAKLLKATGNSWKAMADAFDPAADNAPAGGALAYAEEADKCFARAKELDPKIGVTKAIQAVARLKKRLAPAEE